MQAHQFQGSAADMAALKGMSPFDEFMITRGTGVGCVYEWRGEAGWVQTHDASGAALVSDASNLPIGTQHIREHIALSTTAATFDYSATPIKAAKLIVVSDTAHTAEMVASLAYCVDPPNAAIRDSWLTEGTNLTGDTNRLLLKVGGEETLVFKDPNGVDAPIDYLGIKLDDGAGTLRVICIGVEA